MRFLRVNKFQMLSMVYGSHFLFLKQWDNMDKCVGLPVDGVLIWWWRVWIAPISLAKVSSPQYCVIINDNS